MATLVKQLADLGVECGGVLIVHTAFSRVRHVRGGPQGLVEALDEVLGPEGTLVMPSMSDDDDEPFAVDATPCHGMGVVADTFWRLPGVLRSDSPHAFAAIGPRAATITAPHPVEVPHGLDSPVGRAWELDGQVLLLGVGHDANTMIHLAENLAGVPYCQSKYAVVRRNGQPTRVDYDEVDHCCQRFALLDGWLDESGLQRRAMVGGATARLARARDIVSVTMSRLRLNPIVFLHSPGDCEECDLSRTGMR